MSKIVLDDGGRLLALALTGRGRGVFAENRRGSSGRKRGHPKRSRRDREERAELTKYGEH